MRMLSDKLFINEVYKLNLLKPNKWKYSLIRKTCIVDDFLHQPLLDKFIFF